MEWIFDQLFRDWYFKLKESNQNDKKKSEAEKTIQDPIQKKSKNDQR
jgi:hypothetical protein